MYEDTWGSGRRQPAVWLMGCGMVQTWDYHQADTWVQILPLPCWSQVTWQWWDTLSLTVRNYKVGSSRAALQAVGTMTQVTKAGALPGGSAIPGAPLT